LKFEVLKAAKMKVAVLWVVPTCGLVQVYGLSEVLAASLMRTMKKEAVSAFETSLNRY
jgi:hypothetical protein